MNIINTDFDTIYKFHQFHPFLPNKNNYYFVKDNRFIKIFKMTNLNGMEQIIDNLLTINEEIIKPINKYYVNGIFVGYDILFIENGNSIFQCLQEDISIKKRQQMINDLFYEIITYQKYNLLFTDLCLGNIIYDTNYHAYIIDIDAVSSNKNFKKKSCHYVIKYQKKEVLKLSLDNMYRMFIISISLLDNKCYERMVANYNLDLLFNYLKINNIAYYQILLDIGNNITNLDELHVAIKTLFT